LYTVVLQNQSGYAVDDLEFTDVIPADTTYIASSVTHPGGSTVVSETPVLNITGIDVPAHGQVTVTFRVVVDNPLPAGVTQITNQGTVSYDSDGDGTNDSTQQTDGDTTQPGEQSTDMPVPVPMTLIPTLSDWGVLLLGILLLCAGVTALVVRKADQI